MINPRRRNGHHDRVVPTVPPGRTLLPGVTLVEVLVSMTLLTGVILALGAWIEVTANAAATIQAPLHWHQAADATLRVIGDACSTGDFEREPRANNASRVTVHERTSALTIHTRAPGKGSATLVIEFDERANRLMRKLDVGGETIETRRLIGLVADWHCTFDDDSSELNVTLESTDGETVTRSYTLP